MRLDDVVMNDVMVASRRDLDRMIQVADKENRMTGWPCRKPIVSKKKKKREANIMKLCTDCRSLN